MRITANTLRRIIAEEIAKSSRRRLRESSSERSIRVTPQFINKIIKEELALHKRRQRLAESRRRRSRNSYYY